MSHTIHRHASGAASLGIAVAIACLPAWSGPAQAQSPAQGMTRSVSAEETYRDIEQTLGLVPSFFKAFPDAGIAGAWAEFKAVQLNPQTQLSGKEKELIGLAVAAQVPCHYCVYFHTAAARLHGASEAEIREAVAMAAITRHWSTVLNGMQVDEEQFMKETDTAMAMAAAKMKAGAAPTPATGH
ncbi:carboxymuconolactone decarboxylase family protein [Xanthobacter oligotrophicus]|uniref:carboxymuconolactone decarboxylase family protein n=1 Tax=Xanthobacter oligotrophicus TaxID=2607286 RepID=UPI0011F3DB6D|nr:carboxymuconolactone decarboxylase family protein [Xanthobacter oligotrophicus]MCG5233802.1 carboxymuconolactone decarboxylase family protein [Xanthobacter oligotrophicus]